MRNLDRDRKECYISRLSGSVQEFDEDGLPTGETVQVYGEPVEFLPTVSMTRGDVTSDLFGQALEYDRTITIDDPEFEVSESDIIWVDRTTDDDADYGIKAIRRSDSYTVIAIKKVS